MVKFVEVIMMKKCETGYNYNQKEPAISRTKKEELKKKLLNNNSQKYFFACYKHFLDTFLNISENRVTLMRKAYPLPTLQKFGNCNPTSIYTVH